MIYAILLVAVVAAFFIGLNMGNRPTPLEYDEEAEKAKKLSKEFKEVMNYNLTKALERKR